MSIWEPRGATLAEVWAAQQAASARNAIVLRAQQLPAHAAGHPEIGGQAAPCCLLCLEEESHV